MNPFDRAHGIGLGRWRGCPCGGKAFLARDLDGRKVWVCISCGARRRYVPPRPRANVPPPTVVTRENRPRIPASR